MTGTELVAEIANLLEEDFSLNPIWSQEKLHDFVSQNFPKIAEQTGGSDFQDANISLGSSSGATVVVVNDDTLVGLWHVRSISKTYPIVDIMEVDMLTGVTNPYGPGTPQVCTLELEHSISSGVSVYDPTIRFFPRFSSTLSGTTITYWFKRAPETSQSIGDSIYMRPIFILPLKFLSLADALSADTELADPARAEVWASLSEVLSNALRSLYRGGQLP